MGLPAPISKLAALKAGYAPLRSDPCELERFASGFLRLAVVDRELAEWYYRRDGEINREKYGREGPDHPPVGKDPAREKIMLNSPYAEQWKKMRRIHRRLLLLFLIGPIGWMLIHFLFDPQDHHTGAVSVYLWAWVLFGAWTAYQYQTMPCPRCGEFWGGSWFSLSRVGPSSVLFLRHRCRHCGLDLPEQAKD